MVHREIATSLSLMFSRLGSAFSAKGRNRFTASRIPGRPKTAKARLDQPSGSPLKFQWVAMVSGRRLYTAAPTMSGIRQTRDVQISIFLFFMFLHSLQALDPEQHFLQHGGVETVIDVVLLPALKDEAGLFQL